MQYMQYVRSSILYFVVFLIVLPGFGNEGMLAVYEWLPAELQELCVLQVYLGIFCIIVDMLVARK